MKKINIALIVFIFFNIILIFGRNETIFASSTRDFPVYTGDVYELKDEVSDLSSIVTVSNGNAKIVSVDADGTMTVLQPGETEVGINYVNNAGENCRVNFKILSYLSEGVYRIKNNQSGKNLCLNSLSINYDATLGLANDSSGESIINQLWIIENISEHDYIIRSYADYNTILLYSELHGDIRVEYIPSYIEYEFFELSTWHIRSSFVETVYSNTYGSNRLNLFNLGLGSTENDTWSFELVSDNITGIKLVDEHYPDSGYIKERYMSIGSVKSLNDLKIKLLSFGSQTEHSMTWSSNNLNVARVDASTGEITAVGIGTAKITVTRCVDFEVYSSSFYINVKGYRDGFYNINNLLGNSELKPFSFDNKIFLCRDDSEDETLWYMQCHIDGTYEISLADDKSTQYILLGTSYVEDSLDDTEYVVLDGYPRNSSNKAKWDFLSCGAGKLITYKGYDDRSFIIENNSAAFLFLDEPDFSKNDCMWNIVEKTITKIPKIYINPYYDDYYLEIFNGNLSNMTAAIMGYLNDAKEIFEEKLGVEVYINTPTRFELSEERKQRLNIQGVKNVNKKNDRDIYFEQLTEIVNYNNENDDPYYSYSNKFILYSGYDFINNLGESYDPTGSGYDSIIIRCNYDIANEEQVDRCPYATLHELSHQLGARDHYHTGGDNCSGGDRCAICGVVPYKRPKTCAVNFDTYDPNEPFCNECIMEMKSAVNARCLE